MQQITLIMNTVHKTEFNVWKITGDYRQLSM